MATVITNDFVVTSGDISLFINDLRNSFSFTNYDSETGKLYITSNTYVQLSCNASNALTVAYGNSNGELKTGTLSSASHLYYEIIKSVSGDIAVRINKGVLSENNSLVFAIVKTKNIANEESYAFYIPSTNINSPIAQNSSNMGAIIIIADDVTTYLPSQMLTSVVTTSTSPSYTNFMFGYNTNAKIDAMIRIFSTYSEYISVNARLILCSKSAHNGPTVINNKNYYCITFLALLDE